MGSSHVIEPRYQLQQAQEAINEAMRLIGFATEDGDVAAYLEVLKARRALNRIVKLNREAGR